MAAKYPLALLSPKSHAFINSQYANLERQQGHSGTRQLQIHPADALARSINDGDSVLIANDRGSFNAVVMVTDKVQPGLVVAPLGYWVAASGGSSVAAVNSSRYADIGRAPTFSDTRVEVSAVGAI